jgi:hypothetical protein
VLINSLQFSQWVAKKEQEILASQAKSSYSWNGQAFNKAAGALFK